MTSGTGGRHHFDDEATVSLPHGHRSRPGPTAAGEDLSALARRAAAPGVRWVASDGQTTVIPMLDANGNRRDGKPLDNIVRRRYRGDNPDADTDEIPVIPAELAGPRPTVTANPDEELTRLAAMLNVMRGDGLDATTVIPAIRLDGPGFDPYPETAMEVTTIIPAIRLDPASDEPVRTAKTSGVLRAGAMMAVATLVSRLTGFVAKLILIAAIGFSVVADSYNVANTLPNIVYELLIGGVLTSVAIPLLSRARRDPDGGIAYTNRLLTMTFVTLLVTTALAVLAAPYLIRLYISGNPETTNLVLATDFARLLLPQIMFYGLAALFAAILNTKERFAAGAWAPVVNNLVVIVVGIVLISIAGGIRDKNNSLVGVSSTQFLVLAIGTTAGIVLQAAVMIPALRRAGYRWQWRWGWDKRMSEASRLMGWALIYVVISQIGFIVTTRVASGGAVGAVTTYSFASLLFQLPYGVLGVSILTAMMPRMSRHAAAGDIEAVKDDASLANRLSIIVLTPVAAAMVVLSGAFGMLTASYGEADAADAARVGVTIAAFATGLVPLAVTLVQMRVFYAMKDGRTPTIINGVMVAVRIPLLLSCANLPADYLVAGLALSMSISYLVGTIVGEWWLRRRFGGMGTWPVFVTACKMVATSVIAGLVAWGTLKLLKLPLAGLGDALVQLAVAGVVGLVVLVFAAMVLRLAELTPLARKLGPFGRLLTPRRH